MDELILKPLLTLLLVGMASAYTVGWWRLRAAGHKRIAVTWRLTLYLAGLGFVAVAVLSPIDELATVRFSAHMAQHILLTMAAPPFLLLGNPLPVSLWGLSRSARHAVGRPLIRGGALRRALWTLTLLPVAWLLYVGDLWAWHLPLFYETALRSDLIHALEHLTFFGTAVLFWWPIIEPAPRLRRRVNAGIKIGYLVAATAQNTFLGMLLALPERVLYRHYALTAARRGINPLDDQTLAGGIMWANGHMYLFPILVLLYSFARESARESGGSLA